MPSPADGLDLAAYSPAQLDELAQAIEKQRGAALTRQRSTVKAKITALLADAGLSVTDLTEMFPRPARATKNRRVAFRHPTNSKLTWTGVGRKPKWIQEFEQKTGSIDGARVK